MYTTQLYMYPFGDEMTLASRSSFVFAALISILPLAPKPVVKWSLRSSQPCIPPPASAKKFRGSACSRMAEKVDPNRQLICNIYYFISYAIKLEKY